MLNIYVKLIVLKLGVFVYLVVCCGASSQKGTN